MNVLDLRGPQFLIFYLALLGAIAVALLFARRLFESGAVPKLQSVDPYLVARLRGGAAETIRIAIFALVDRGLLEATGDELRAKARASDQVRRPLERAIIAALIHRRPAYELIKDDLVLASTDSLAGELVGLGLLPSPTDRLRRLLFGFVAIVVLWSVAAAKVQVALARGKHNIGFLIVLALASVVVIVLVLNRPRTARGDRLLADLRELFAALRQRSARLRAGGGSQELALLIAVFGLPALHGGQLALSQRLFPKTASSGSSGSGCGSSCSSGGSSCGSSCGGGCGGGGCGGCGS